jgi:hypothetical protein
MGSAYAAEVIDRRAPDEAKERFREYPVKDVRRNFVMRGDGESGDSPETHRRRERRLRKCHLASDSLARRFPDSVP